MNNNQSIPTIEGPQFINLQPLDKSPLMSRCEIKVLYVGQNRNGSFITKETATEMSKTLRGCPIVGYFSEKAQDFADHGDQMVIDGDGIKFNCLTKPYGFVSPDAKIWFKTFEDTDEFGNTVVREYLMTEGYLWTGQYEEAKKAFEEGKGQSMELDGDSLDGHWATDNNSGCEFFIINDAIFSKLCILGDEVEPCFEGASVTAPNVSANFSKNSEFMSTLFTMIKELKDILNSNGGVQMEQNEVMPVENSIAEADKIGEENSLNFNKEIETFAKEEKKEEIPAEEDKEAPAKEEDAPAEDDEKKKEVEKSALKDDEDKTKCALKKDDETDSSEEKDNKEDSSTDDTEAEEDDKKKKFELLEADYNDMKDKYTALLSEVQELRNFKQEIEDKEKDELINSFYMLSDEDKKDIIMNKSNYSLKEIKSELCILCYDKKVSYNQTETVPQTAPITYDLNNHDAENLPAWLNAVEETRKRNK